MKSSRMTILLDPDDKQAIDARAAGLGLKSSEFVRRAVEAYDPANQDGDLAELVKELAETAKRTDHKLSMTLERMDRFQDFWGSREKLRASQVMTIDQVGVDAVGSLIE